MKVYEGVIEIVMQPFFTRVSDANHEVMAKLEALRKRHKRKLSRSDVYSIYAHGQELLAHLEHRGHGQGDRPAVAGYIGYQNCVFSLLYGVFGIDILRFLFDRDWVPSADIDPFSPSLFLKRLSMLQKEAKKLKDGTTTPVRLESADSYIRKGMGPTLVCFSQDEHRLLLDASLQELHDFGKLGLELQREGEAQRVHINIYIPYGDYDSETLKFATTR